MLSKTNKIFLAFLCVAVLVSIPAFFVSAAKEAGTTKGLAISLAASFTQVVATWCFISSLSTFKRDLKIAYYFVALGILVFSFTQIEIPLTYFWTPPTTFIANALIVVPYALGALLMYIGVHIFARLLQIRYFLNSWLLVFGFSLIVAGAFSFLPHSELALSERTFDLIIDSAAWCGAFSLVTMFLVLRIRQEISVIYKQAMLWFAISLGVLTFTIYHEIFTKLYLAIEWYVGDVSLWPFLLTGILFLKAGIAFKQTGGQMVQLPANPTYVDIVVETAQKVSRSEIIDAKLDTVRSITSRGPDAPLSATDKQALVRAYADIERYLVYEEPLQKLTIEGLRSGLPTDFLQDLHRLKTS